MHLDNMGEIYKDYFTFRVKKNLGGKKEDELEKRIVWEKSKYNRYELLT